MMAVWRRKPPPGVMDHSGQGHQSCRSAWQGFLKARDPISGTSRRGDRHDNAVAECFFQLPKW